MGQTLYLSGSIGLDPTTGQFAGESVQEQARQVNSKRIRFFFCYLDKFSR